MDLNNLITTYYKRDMVPILLKLKNIFEEIIKETEDVFKVDLNTLYYSWIDGKSNLF